MTGISSTFAGHVEEAFPRTTRAGRTVLSFTVRYVYRENFGGRSTVRCSFWTDDPAAVLEVLRPGAYLEVWGQLYLRQFFHGGVHNAVLCCAVESAVVYQVDHQPIATLRQIGIGVEIEPASVPALRRYDHDHSNDSEPTDRYRAGDCRPAAATR